MQAYSIFPGFSIQLST